MVPAWIELVVAPDGRIVRDRFVTRNRLWTQTSVVAPGIPEENNVTFTGPPSPACLQRDRNMENPHGHTGSRRVW